MARQQSPFVWNVDHLAEIVTSSPDAILVTDIQGTLLYWSSGASVMYGYSSEEMVGQPVTDLMPPECKHEAQYIAAEMHAGREIRRLETVRLRKNGSRIHVSIAVVPETDESGQVVRVISRARDISAAVELDRRLLDTAETLGTEIAHLEAFTRELNSSASHADMFKHSDGNDSGSSGGEITFPVRDLRTQLANATSTLQSQIERLKHFALHDPLTGLANRVQFFAQLQDALDNPSPSTVELLMIDIDNFKIINDTLGHHAGDQLLKEIAERLTNATRTRDVVARTGGDEFAVLVFNHGVHCAEPAASRILRHLNQPASISGHSVTPSASVGIASVIKNGRDKPEDVMRNADLAMYHAKKSGKNTWRNYNNDLYQDLVTGLLLEEDLRRALDAEQLSLVFQPIFRAATGELYAAEVLLRWRHPDLGNIAPDEFIPIAENSGLIERIGRWVLEQACRQAANFKRAGFDLKISVNVSPQQLAVPGFAKIVCETLADAGIAPEKLSLEVTESAITTVDETIVAELRHLREGGVHLAVDDFGTGHSSLARLRSLPFDRLKIDKSFIDHIAEDKESRIIVDAVIAMAHRLGLSVIAEGVETEEQLQCLRELECDSIQGYLLGKPMLVHQLAELLQAPVGRG